MAVFIYGLKCPVSGSIRYIGKAVKPRVRWRKHIREANQLVTNSHSARWIRMLKAKSMEPGLVILHQVKDGESWQELERFFIRQGLMMGWPLTNETDGGDSGVAYLNPAYKEKWRAIGYEIGSRPEVKAAKSAAMKAQYADPVIGAMRRAVNSSPEKRQQISNARKANWANPEYRQAAIAKAREVHRVPERRKAKSEQTKSWWMIPENRRKARSSMARHHITINGRTQSLAEWSRESGIGFSTLYFRMTRGSNPEDLLKPPDVSHAASARAAKARATPEYRAMMAEKTRQSWIKRRATS